MSLLDNSDKLLRNYLEITTWLNLVVTTIANKSDKKNLEVEDTFLELKRSLVTRLKLLELNMTNIDSYIPIEEDLSYLVLKEYHQSIVSLIGEKATYLKVAIMLVNGLYNKVKQ
jgi:hypothetical protein